MVYDSHLKRRLFLLGLVFVSVSGAYSTPLSDHIETVLDQNESRQQRALKKLLRDPFPSKGAQGGAGLWHYENFALVAYGLNQRTAEADAGILTLHRDLFEDANSHHDAGAIHWHAYLQQRIYGLYSSSSKHFPGRMSLEAENAILHMLWDFAAPICDIAFTDLDKIWWHWGSENHHLLAWVSFWGGAHIFKDHPNYTDRRYQDGSKPAEMSAVFDAYFKHYARERASKGLFIEVASPTYAKYSLNTLYYLYDFADDPVLKKVERDDWHFVEAPQAFAALRIARGGAQWEEDTLAQRRDGKGADGLGQWLVLQKQLSPIIIEVVCKSDYASFEDFQSAILRNHFAYTSSEVTYQSEFYKAKLSLPLRYNRQPEINGIPVNMSPDYVYRCPYIKGDFGNGVIRIQYRGVSQTVDFNDNVSVITSSL